MLLMLLKKVFILFSFNFETVFNIPSFFILSRGKNKKIINFFQLTIVKVNARSF